MFVQLYGVKDILCRKLRWVVGFWLGPGVSETGFRGWNPGGIRRIPARKIGILGNLREDLGNHHPGPLRIQLISKYLHPRKLTNDNQKIHHE